jgi:hypothetical protein
MNFAFHGTTPCTEVNRSRDRLGSSIGELERMNAYSERLQRMYSGQTSRFYWFPELRPLVIFEDAAAHLRELSRS